MKKWLQRTELLIKSDNIEKLQNTNVLLVGLGGVGSYAAEFLVRAGIGKLTIVDGDIVDITNVNRQLPATHQTVGKSKTEIMQQRLLAINPELQLTAINEFLSPQRMHQIVTPEYHFVLDCIDSISPKLQLIKACVKQKIKIISAMGAGGKTDVTKVLIRDISKTKECFLARKIRKDLRKDKINKGVRCVFSTEIQDEKSVALTDGTHFKKSYYGTISYIPALFGLYVAYEVIRKVTEKNQKKTNY